MTGQQPLRSRSHGGNANSNRREVSTHGEEEGEESQAEEVQEGMRQTEDRRKGGGGNEEGHEKRAENHDTGG